MELRVMPMLAAFIVAAFAPTIARAETPLARFPQVHGARMVFVAYGNLWTAPRTGGAAQRLTNDPGQAMLPRFSPDGKWIAYTATTPGNQDVYVVPATGGVPRRLTFRSTLTGPGTTHAVDDNLVATWTPDSRAVVFLSRRASFNDAMYRAFTVDVAGGVPHALPLDRSGFLSYGPNGHTIAFDRNLRDFLTWKRYDGGLAPSVYTYDFATKALVRITDSQRTDTAPMWYGRTIYFSSDRDAHRRANIWAYDLDTKRTREVTHFTDFDIDVPALGGDAIAFQQGGALNTLDLPSETLHRVPIAMPAADAHTAVRSVALADAVRDTDAIGQSADYALTPHGDRAIVAARGNLYAADPGGTRALTTDLGVDNDRPAVSPDGRFVAYTTDRTGNRQIAIRPLAGGAERVVTHFAAGYFFKPTWSPDGTTLLVADIGHELFLVRSDGGPARRIAMDPYATILDAGFSPDGRWIAYSAMRASQQHAIHLYEIATGRDTIVSGLADDRNPVFSPDGNELYFLSKRTFLPFSSETDQIDIANVKADGIYVAILRADGRSPFLAGDGARAATTPGAAQAPLRIDLAHLADRVVPVPIDAADIASMTARGTTIYYQTQPLSDLAGDPLPGEAATLHAYDLAARTDRAVVQGLDTYALSADGTHVLYTKDGVRRIAATASGSHDDRALDFATLRAQVDPRREWAEMFDDAWRIERDAFFDRATDGVDWQAVRNAYRRFVPRLGSRDDLTYLIGQMIGELGSSHTFVGGGDTGDTRPPTATPLLGAEFERIADGSPFAGRYRIAHIVPGDDARARSRSPLTEPGLGVSEGDVILAIDGHDLLAPATPDALLAGTTGNVSLTLAARGTAPQRTIVVRPLRNEFGVRKEAWIARNRGIVAAASGGRVCYVYLQDFFDRGSGDFMGQAYPQQACEALIFDVRWNDGGFTSQFVLDALRRTRAGIFTNREGATQNLPSTVFPRAQAVVADEFSSSDGDQFPYYFRADKLGPVIGTRTWGGVRGLDGGWRLRDDGFITAPKDVLTTPDGTHIIENVGVAPDIAVDTRPDDVDTMHDTQLEAAVNALLSQLPKQRP